MDTVRACVERHAADSPDRTFLIAPETGNTLSFAQLKEAVDDVGERLIDWGSRKGPRSPSC